MPKAKTRFLPNKSDNRPATGVNTVARIMYVANGHAKRSNPPKLLVIMGIVVFIMVVSIEATNSDNITLINTVILLFKRTHTLRSLYHFSCHHLHLFLNIEKKLLFKSSHNNSWIKTDFIKYTLYLVIRRMKAY